MANVLVTGGCGYIGSHVVKELSLSGHKVVVLDNLSTGFKEALVNNETLVLGDVGDSALLARTLAYHKIEAVLHFAASIVVPESVSKPLTYYRNNTANLLSLLEVMDLAQVRHIIFSSTASVYGNGRSAQDLTPGEMQAFHEKLPPSPESPYGWSKFFSEQIIRDQTTAKGLKHVILRYFNVAGADPDLQIGQRSPNATHLIKIACETAVGKRSGMQIYGDDYPTKDGTCIRDYIHVTDLAKAHVLALDHLLKGGDSRTLNCGYGQGFSVKEVLNAVERCSGHKLNVTMGPRRPGDAVIVLAKPDEIYKVLPWQPRYKDIDTIVGHALRWEQKMSR